MPTTDHDRVHTALPVDECLQLLTTAPVGRLAYTQSALPAVRPVTFRVAEGELRIPAQLGSPLLHAVQDAVVAVEADAYDDALTGWTVTVVGHSRVLDPGSVEAPAGTRLIAVQLGLIRGWWTAAG